MKQVHLPGVDEPTGIVELEDGWVISALSSSKYMFTTPVSSYFAKIDLNGNTVWERFYGDTTVAFYIYMDQSFMHENNALFRAKDGNVIALGTSGLNYYGAPLIIKLNPENGDTIWTYKENFNDYFDGLDAVEDNDGNIYFLVMRNYLNKAGYPCVYKVSKDGKLMWKNHLKQYAETMPTKIFMNNGDPVFSVTLVDEIRFRDSVVLQKMDHQSGKLRYVKILEPKKFGLGTYSSGIEQLYPFDSIYNVLLSSSTKQGFKTQLFLDTGLNVLHKKFINDTDSAIYINPFYGCGYTRRGSYRVMSFTDLNDKVELVAQTCFSDSGDSMITYMFQSKHGGAIQLGWVFTEGMDKWRSCTDRIDCKDIIFVKSDTLGRYFPNTPPTFGKVIIYPNPVTDKLKIQFELKLISSVNIQFYDDVGVMVYEHNTEKLLKGFHEITVDVSGLSKGIYIVKFNNENLHAINKIVIY